MSALLNPIASAHLALVERSASWPVGLNGELGKRLSISDQRQLAHDDIDRGDTVFPLVPWGKKPVIPSAHPEGDPLRGRCKGECGQLGHGLHDATSDHNQIDRWWSQWPNANRGIPTGHRFDLLDIDGPEALASLDAVMPLAEDPDDDPMMVGPTIRTVRGWHVQVAPSGRGNTAGIGGLDVDWRGVGGYCVAAGSRGRGGDWHVLLPGDPDFGLDAPLQPCPTWVFDLWDQPRDDAKPGFASSNLAGSDRYGQAALERSVGRLACAPEGQRNHVLNAEAFGLAKLVRDGHLRGSDVALALHQVAMRTGLPDREARRTIDSGLGTARP